MERAAFDKRVLRACYDNLDETAIDRSLRVRHAFAVCYQHAIGEDT